MRMKHTICLIVLVLLKWTSCVEEVQPSDDDVEEEFQESCDEEIQAPKVIYKPENDHIQEIEEFISALKSNKKDAETGITECCNGLVSWQEHDTSDSENEAKGSCISQIKEKFELLTETGDRKYTYKGDRFAQVCEFAVRKAWQVNSKDIVACTDESIKQETYETFLQGIQMYNRASGEDSEQVDGILEINNVIWWNDMIENEVITDETILHAVSSPICGEIHSDFVEWQKKNNKTITKISEENTRCGFDDVAKIVSLMTITNNMKNKRKSNILYLTQEYFDSIDRTSLNEMIQTVCEVDLKFTTLFAFFGTCAMANLGVGVIKHIFQNVPELELRKLEENDADTAALMEKQNRELNTEDMSYVTTHVVLDAVNNCVYKTETMLQPDMDLDCVTAWFHIGYYGILMGLKRSLIIQNMIEETPDERDYSNPYNIKSFKLSKILKSIYETQSGSGCQLNAEKLLTLINTHLWSIVYTDLETVLQELIEKSASKCDVVQNFITETITKLDGFKTEDDKLRVWNEELQTLKTK